MSTCWVACIYRWDGGSGEGGSEYIKRNRTLTPELCAVSSLGSRSFGGFCLELGTRSSKAIRGRPLSVEHALGGGAALPASSLGRSHSSPGEPLGGQQPRLQVLRLPNWGVSENRIKHSRGIRSASLCQKE